MIYVKPTSAKSETSINSKTFSYSDVEDLLYELVMCIDNLEIMHENNMILTPIINNKDRGLDIIVEQDNKICKLFFDLNR